MNHLTFVKYVKIGASFTLKRADQHAVFTMQPKRKSLCISSAVPGIKAGDTYTLRPRAAIYVEDTESIAPTKVEQSNSNARHYLSKK